MKTVTASLIAIALCAGAANAAPSSVFTGIADSAPRSVFTDLAGSAPRSVFDDIRDTAPRSSTGKGFFLNLQRNAP